MSGIKKIIPILLFFLMINAVIAEELKVTLVAYNPEKKSAQIRIENTGSKDYYDLTMAIDNSEPQYIVGLLRVGNAIKIPRGIPPGKRTITVSTAEGVTVTKEIDFPKSQKQIEEELEIKKKVAESKGETPQEKKTAERVYERKNNTLRNVLIIIFILILLFLIIFFYMKNRKKKGFWEKNKSKEEEEKIKKKIKERNMKATMFNYPQHQQIYSNNYNTVKTNLPLRNYHNNIVNQQHVIRSNNVFDRLKGL